MDIMKDFVERLKELLTDNGFNTSSFEKKYGFKNNTISNWLNFKNLPSIKTLIPLSEFLKCSIDFLLGRKDLPDYNSFTLESSFPERLKLLAKERKKSLHSVAVDFKMPDGTFYNWAKSVHSPSIEWLIKLANYFNCSVDYLIGRKE